MKYVAGQAPEWRGKPKASPLDDDAEFQKFLRKLTGGTMEEGDLVVVYVHQIDDAKRLHVKNPWRMVRDHVNRVLKENGLSESYRVTCRQTTEENVWGVQATRLADPHARKRRTA